MYVTFAKTVVPQMGTRQSLAKVVPLRILFGDTKKKALFW